MGYVALYRKYRPNTFDGIVGQENVTKILKNQIKSGKISHAYIFSGTRGTGKTSAAKVFSRAINCLNPVDGEPCNECEICKGILNGNIADVIEMDAASNNSVENIRQIRQEVVYATIDVKYRVYIIDEAHMLTTSAFNALLKTLEEPPENVVFILATTEQHKIPVTILSRCLRFEFNRISELDIFERLKMVLNIENVSYEDEALKYIAKLADGGMRDALSILERCISESSENLKYEDVLKIVGAVENETIQEISEDILNSNLIHMLEKIDDIITRGKDLRQINYQLINNFLERIISDNNKNTYYTKIIDRLSKLDNDLRLTSKPDIVFKAAIIEICNISENQEININDITVSTENNNISNRISKLELEIEELRKILKKSNSINSKISVKDNVENNIKYDTKEIMNDFKENDKLTSNDEIDEKLKKAVIEAGHIKLYSALASTKIYTGDTGLVIVTNNSFAYSIINSDNNLEIIKLLYNNIFGSEVNIIVKLNESNVEVKDSKMEDILKKNNVDYTKLD